MILAFMAGAKPVPEHGGLKRTSATSRRRRLVRVLDPLRGPGLGARGLRAGDTRDRHAAARERAGRVRDGVPHVQRRRGGQRRRPAALRGLRPPESRTVQERPEPDHRQTGIRRRTARPELKPEMSVLYVPANDMLHAFRAGPNVEDGDAINLEDLTNCYSPVRTPRATPSDRWPATRDRMAATTTAAARSCGASCPTTSSASCAALRERAAESRQPRVHAGARHPLRRRVRAGAGATTGTRDIDATFTKIVGGKTVTARASGGGSSSSAAASAAST